MSLQMRRACGRCGAALENVDIAFMCSHECTFCATCAPEMDHTYPNCGGELVARPRRVGDAASV